MDIKKMFLTNLTNKNSIIAPPSITPNHKTKSHSKQMNYYNKSHHNRTTYISYKYSNYMFYLAVMNIYVL